MESSCRPRRSAPSFEEGGERNSPLPAAGGRLGWRMASRAALLAKYDISFDEVVWSQLLYNLAPMRKCPPWPQYGKGIVEACLSSCPWTSLSPLAWGRYSCLAQGRGQSSLARLSPCLCSGRTVVAAPATASPLARVSAQAGRWWQRRRWLVDAGGLLSTLVRQLCSKQ